VALADTLRDRLGLELRDLAGAVVRGEVPIGEDLVNRLIAERIRNHPHVAALRVEARPDDVVEIDIAPRRRLMPSLRITARIERQPEFPADPTLVVRWSVPAAGPLAMFAAPVLSYFRKMPPGLRMDGDRLFVDVRALLRARGQGELLDFVRRGTIHTRPGGFVATFELTV
jgi:hypothetical protein